MMNEQDYRIRKGLKEAFLIYLIFFLPAYITQPFGFAFLIIYCADTINKTLID